MRTIDIPLEMLVCLMQHKHASVPYTPGPGEYKGPRWGYTYHLRCENCGSIRHITIDSVGNYSVDTYDRPQRYQDALDAVRDAALTAADLRVLYAKKRNAIQRLKQRQAS